MGWSLLSARGLSQIRASSREARAATERWKNDRSTESAAHGRHAAASAPRDTQAEVGSAATYFTKEDIMATACLFMGWDRPVAGKESEAYGFLMREVSERIEGFRRDGWFESFQTIGITPHGGNLNGFLLLLGERAKLDELRRTDGFEALSMKIGTLFLGYGVVPCVTGEGLEKVKQRNPQLFK
jgi:hypothetical protein